VSEARIYSAAEAKALRDAAPAGPYEAWHPDDMPGRSVVVGGSERHPPYDHFVVGIEDRVRVPLAELFAAAPDLAASVIVHANDAAALRAAILEHLAAIDEITHGADPHARVVAAEAALRALVATPAMPTGTEEPK
jgi:predicted amidohydrolase